MVTSEEAMQESTRRISLHKVDSRTGKTAKPTPSKLMIPNGVREGQQRIRLAGQREPSLAQGRPGALFLRVSLSSNPNFKLIGSDLYFDLETILRTTAIVRSRVLRYWSRGLITRKRLKHAELERMDPGTALPRMTSPRRD